MKARVAKRIRTHKRVRETNLVLVAISLLPFGKMKPLFRSVLVWILEDHAYRGVDVLVDLSPGRIRGQPIYILYN